MTNRPARAGRDYENRVIDFLAGIYPTMERRRLNGRFDRGDFVNTGHWTLEAKNEKTIQWSKALTEAETEMKHNKTKWCAAVINRRNHGIGKSYVLMTLEQFARILSETEGLA